MKLSSIWPITCVSLFLAGLACLFVGMNPGFLSQMGGSPERGGIIEDSGLAPGRPASVTPPVPGKEGEEKHPEKETVPEAAPAVPSWNPEQQSGQLPGSP